MPGHRIRHSGQYWLRPLGSLPRRPVADLWHKHRHRFHRHRRLDCCARHATGRKNRHRNNPQHVSNRHLFGLDSSSGLDSRRGKLSGWRCHAHLKSLHHRSGILLLYRFRIWCWSARQSDGRPDPYNQITVGLCRSGVEITVVFIGWKLGGMVGVGTILAAVGIGFCVQTTFRLLKFDTTAIQHETLGQTLHLEKFKA